MLIVKLPQQAFELGFLSAHLHKQFSASVPGENNSTTTSSGNPGPSRFSLGKSYRVGSVWSGERGDSVGSTG